jgi:hypothetical protein
MLFEAKNMSIAAFNMSFEAPPAEKRRYFLANGIYFVRGQKKASFSANKAGFWAQRQRYRGTVIRKNAQIILLQL